MMISSNKSYKTAGRGQILENNGDPMQIDLDSGNDDENDLIEKKDFNRPFAMQRKSATSIPSVSVVETMHCPWKTITEN